MSTGYGSKDKEPRSFNTDRHSPYKDLPTSGASSRQLDQKMPRKPSQGEFKAARGIKNELLGGLAGMAREAI